MMSLFFVIVVGVGLARAINLFKTSGAAQSVAGSLIELGLRRLMKR